MYYDVTLTPIGADRFAQDIAMMTGRQTSVLLRVVWFIVLPVILIVSYNLYVSYYYPQFFKVIRVKRTYNVFISGLFHIVTHDHCTIYGLRRRR